MKTMSSDREVIQPPLARRLMLIVGATALVLLVPLLAMQFTREVDWTLFDFVVAGGLLVSTGLIWEMASRKISNPRSRAIAGVVIALAFFLVWAELAVGIFH
ncbi:MAG: hypothetical protein ABWY27_02975 [Telluria sp.]